MKQIWLYASLILYMTWYSPATTAQNPNDFCGGMVYSQIPNASVFRDIVRLNNQTYVAVGIKGISSTQNELYLINFDMCFDTLWVKFYGGLNSRYTGHFMANIDATSFVMGCSYAPNYSISQNYKCLLLKFNLEGDTLWSKTYSLGMYNEGIACIIPTTDNGFMIGGFSNNFPDNNAPSQAWLIKTDSEGNMEWNKTYGFANASEIITGIIPNADGTYTIAASRNGGTTSTWVFKTDSVGNILWNRIHGNGNFTYPITIKALPDGFLIAGIERIYGYPDYGDGFLLKIDTLGYQQWFKLYGGPFTDGFTDLHVLENGGVIALGAYENNGWGGDYADAWLMKLTAEGDSIWSHTYAYNGAIPIADYVWGITDTPQDGFMFSGFTSVFNADSTTLTQTAWVVRTDSLGNACYLPAGCEWAVGIPETPTLFEGGQGGELFVYPNPATHSISIATNLQWETTTLFNLHGRKMTDFYYTNSPLLLPDNLPNGLYLMQIILQNGQTQTAKLFISK